MQDMRCQLIPGSEANIPDVNRVSSSNILGKGGNGMTFKYPLLNKEFAVKFVSCQNMHLCMYSAWGTFSWNGMFQKDIRKLFVSLTVCHMHDEKA